MKEKNTIKKEEVNNIIDCHGEWRLLRYKMEVYDDLQKEYDYVKKIKEMQKALQIEKHYLMYKT